MPVGRCQTNEDRLLDVRAFPFRLLPFWYIEAKNEPSLFMVGGRLSPRYNECDIHREWREGPGPTTAWQPGSQKPRCQSQPARGRRERWSGLMTKSNRSSLWPLFSEGLD